MTTRPPPPAASNASGARVESDALPSYDSPDASLVPGEAGRDQADRDEYEEPEYYDGAPGVDDPKRRDRLGRRSALPIRGKPRGTIFDVQPRPLRLRELSQEKYLRFQFAPAIATSILLTR